MKLREVRIQIFENATAATLVTDVNAFLADGEERELVSIQLEGDRALVVYTT
jgi:hypothetical protein